MKCLRSDSREFRGWVGSGQPIKELFMFKRTIVAAVLVAGVAGVAMAGRVVAEREGPATQAAGGKVEYFVNKEGLAAGGNDVVSYFEGKAEKGVAEFEVVHGGAKFRFVSKAHLEAFVAAPGKYAPQYGGWCAMGMAGGYKAPTDAAAFTVVEGKLYLNYSAKVTEMWAKDREALIVKADKNWPEVSKK